MVYADYWFYTGSYYGNKVSTESEFNGLALKASAFLDAMTFDRIAQDAEIPSNVKHAMCAVVDVMAGFEDGSGIVASETVGELSRTYSREDGLPVNKACYEAAYLYLINTGLLYRGVSDGL